MRLQLNLRLCRDFSPKHRIRPRLRLGCRLSLMVMFDLRLGLVLEFSQSHAMPQANDKIKIKLCLILVLR